MMASAESSPHVPPGSEHSYFAFEKTSSSTSSHSPRSRPGTSGSSSAVLGSPITISKPNLCLGSNTATLTAAKNIFDQKPLPDLQPTVPQIKNTVSPPSSPMSTLDLQRAMSKLPHQLNPASHTNSKFTNCTGMDITPIQTMEQFQSITQPTDDVDVVVLDLRPFNQYNVSRVKDALSICVPTTLLKRSSFHLSNIFKTMVKTQENSLQSKLESPRDLRAVFYDSSSDFKHCSLHLYQIIKKFKDSMEDYDKDISLYIVDRGFAMFQEAETPSSSLSLIDHSKFKSSTTTESNTTMSHAFSNFVLPSADAASAFVMSIKNNTVFPDTKGTKLRAPLVKDAQELPNWLQRYATPDAVNAVIANFQNIEIMENARIGASVRRRKSSTLSNNSSRGSPTGSTNSPGDYITLNGSEYGMKNRYPNILPYEHSRVKLIPSPMSSTGTPGATNQLSLKMPMVVSPNSAISSISTSSKRTTDDYFNANFINVPQINKDAKYIATQAPLPTTIDDFWKVVWHNNVEVIVTLTNLDENGHKKSDVYWQESSQVHLISEEDDFQGVKNLTVRTIQLTKRGHVRIIRQLHLKGWPDFGVLEYSELLELIRVKDQFVSDARSPIVVHCSAGCGRTGVFITIDLILEAFRKSHHSRLSEVEANSLNDAASIDIWRTDEDLIYYTVQQLRKQRISMVQGLDQFVFCYESLLQYFSALQSS